LLFSKIILRKQARDPYSTKLLALVPQTRTGDHCREQALLKDARVEMDPKSANPSQKLDCDS